MAISEESLGGRLPLLRPADLDADQQMLYAQLVAATKPWAEKTGFRVDTAAGQLIGPFNPMLRSPLLAQAALYLTAAEEKHTALSAKVRQVVILIVGARWQAAYELYAHRAAGTRAGLDAPTIAALVAGQKPASLSAEESVAYDFTHRLTAAHQIDPALYGQAVAAFGEKGVVDMIYLAGNYMTTSALLNIFAVPVPPAAASR